MNHHRAKVESIAFGGNGIARMEGLVTFVPFTAPQDEILYTVTKKKKNFQEGKLLKVLSPSPWRTEPLCPYFGICGGCQLQHIQYENQLEIKRKFVQDALLRIAKTTFPVPEVRGSTLRLAYREHILLHIEEGRVGYIADGALLPIDRCPIFSDGMLPPIQSLHLQGMGWVRILKNGNRYLLVFSLPECPSALSILEKMPGCQGVAILHPHGIEEAGDLSMTSSFHGLKFHFSPYGFLQNHPEQSQALYSSLLEMSRGGTLLDLYCGVGITSLLCAQKSTKVTGIDLNPHLIKAAEKNRILNHIPHVDFHCGAAEVLAPRFLPSVDTVILNPPRVGVDTKLLQALIQARPREILYISCMPPTLARDIKPLLQGGYHITEMRLFDMFPQTTHVEVLVRLNLSS